MSTQDTRQLIEDAALWVRQTYLHTGKKYYLEKPIEKKALQSVKKSSEAKGKSAQLFNPYIEKFKDIEVLVIQDGSENQEVELMERMTKAIDSRIAKAKHIKAQSFEKEDQWAQLLAATQKLRAVLISEVELYRLPALMMHYQKSPRRMIGKAPLFLMADLKAYNQDLELKRSLWNTLLSQLT